MEKGNQYNHKLPDIETLKKIYFEDGISTLKIAATFGVTSGAVKIKFNRYGIKLKTRINPQIGKKSYERTAAHKKSMSELIKKLGIHKGIPRTDEHKQKISNNSPWKGIGCNKGKVLSEEWKRKLSIAQTGKNGSNWQGGISFEPYPIIWTRSLKKAIKQRDGHLCQLCFNKGIAVHHIDYIKKNCFLDNLITLCLSCNAKVNFNRDHWMEYFMKIIKGRTNVAYKN